jgi:transcriptional regulator with XRE-family HTH domain
VDIRTVLAQNIKSAREALNITQAKLAEFAEISLPYLTDIERRRTWVSDKTLQNLARALNLEPWELLNPARDTAAHPSTLNRRKDMARTAKLITEKKVILRHAVEGTMEDLIMELLRSEEK